MFEVILCSFSTFHSIVAEVLYYINYNILRACGYYAVVDITTLNIDLNFKRINLTKNKQRNDQIIALRLTNSTLSNKMNKWISLKVFDFRWSSFVGLCCLIYDENELTLSLSLSLSEGASSYYWIKSLPIPPKSRDIFFKRLKAAHSARIFLIFV